MQSVRPHPTTGLRSRSLRLVPVARQVLGLTAVVLALVAFVGCASSKPGGPKSAGGDVSYTSLSKNTKLRMVSDAWVEAQGYEGIDADERRADFYGKNVYTVGSSSAAVKVCDDPIFDGIVQALDAAGFSQYAAPGPASASGGGATHYLELSVDGQVRHFARTKGMSPEAVKAFQTCLSVFGEVFNAVEGYQSGDGSFQFNSAPAPAGS
jgi:hypothetical protein